jgi:hypothetical protein
MGTGRTAPGLVTPPRAGPAAAGRAVACRLAGRPGQSAGTAGPSRRGPDRGGWTVRARLRHGLPASLRLGVSGE